MNAADIFKNREVRKVLPKTALLEEGNVADTLYFVKEDTYDVLHSHSPDAGSE